jgi:SAM-dependent methyltransferase
MLHREEKRILVAYAKRAERARFSRRFYGYQDLPHMFSIQERHRELLRMLERFGYRNLRDLNILDVGCGDGNMLRQFLQWGSVPERLAGIDLRQEAVDKALSLSPHLDIRLGSAAELPWDESFFDLVCLNTVFTSILDPVMRARVAAEVRRVLRNGGAVLWYDFIYSTPTNPDVRAVTGREIRTLFGGFEIHLRRITLAPPIRRRLPNWSFTSILYSILASIPFLRTHYLGLFIKRDHNSGHKLP